VLKDFLQVLGLGGFKLLIDLIFFVLSPIFFVLERIASGKRKSFKSILITGGNSGLGEVLALAFAKPGVRLVLTARNADKLQSVKAKCEKLGSQVVTESVDVTDKKAMAAVIEKVDSENPLDLVIANAGVSPDSLGLKYIDESSEPLLDVNVQGVLNTIFPIIPRFRKRKSGQIALMSSQAGLAPLPSSPVYSASKVCVRYLGEGLRPLLAVDRVGVSVICPGFVKSPMTDVLVKKKIYLPLLMEADEAAQIMKDGLERNVSIIAFPFAITFMTSLLSGLVAPLRERFISFTSPKRGARTFFQDS